MRMMIISLAAFFLSGSYGCNGLKRKKQYPDTPMYNLTRPALIELPELLDEISGIAYYPKDTSVFAIIDEEATLFKIPLNKPSEIRMWPFGKNNDYEDLILKDSTFYILASNGNIEVLTFSGNVAQVEKRKFKDHYNGAVEFESLWDDSVNNQLVLLCKDCEPDGKKTVSSFVYRYADSLPSFQPYAVWNTLPVAEKIGKDKIHLKASAAAINPITHDLYIISAIHHILVIASSSGDIKEVYRLDPALYKQPEGISFTPAGDMIIANERAETGFANLLLLKNKLKPE
jgi:uncharacterized protein YjiK